METLNLRIKRLRSERGYSQDDLARLVGVSRVAVLKWESGQIENLKLANLSRLRDIFGVSYDYLIDGCTTTMLAAQPAAPWHTRPSVRRVCEIAETINDDGIPKALGYLECLAAEYPMIKQKRG